MFLETKHFGYFKFLVSRNLHNRNLIRSFHDAFSDLINRLAIQMNMSNFISF